MAQSYLSWAAVESIQTLVDQHSAQGIRTFPNSISEQIAQIRSDFVSARTGSFGALKVILKQKGIGRPYASEIWRLAK